MHVTATEVVFLHIHLLNIKKRQKQTHKVLSICREFCLHIVNREETVGDHIISVWYSIQQSKQIPHLTLRTVLCFFLGGRVWWGATNQFKLSKLMAKCYIYTLSARKPNKFIFLKKSFQHKKRSFSKTFPKREPVFSVSPLRGTWSQRSAASDTEFDQLSWMPSLRVPRCSRALRSAQQLAAYDFCTATIWLSDLGKYFVRSLETSQQHAVINESSSKMFRELK